TAWRLQRLFWAVLSIGLIAPMRARNGLSAQRHSSGILPLAAFSKRYDPMIQKLIDLFFRFLALLMILALASMALMVFVNVVLRYGMNSGIAISDEMSRYFFVWLTFIGAVVAHRENLHMGVETVVSRF